MITKLDMLKMLKEKVCQCTKCPELVKNRIQTVFGEGNNNAKILLCGEGPGQHEDETGRPFVGRAGELLDNILLACGIKREDVYITNILRCRPPNNRTPKDEECANCRPFLDLQIKIVNPKYIVCLGTVAAQKLLNVETPISYLRGKWYEYKGIKVLCSYHPAFLLRNQDRKKDVWDDMQLLIKEINSL